jgi:hypothetical protein
MEEISLDQVIRAVGRILAGAAGPAVGGAA